MNIYHAILYRDISRFFARRGGLLQLAFLFIMICTLFPLAIGIENAILARIAPAIMLLSLIITTTLSIPRSYEEDYKDGSLEQYLILPILPSQIFLAKSFASWATCALPLVFLCPFMGIIFHLSSQDIIDIAISFTLATPSICLICSMVTIFTLGTNKTLLYILLSLPLYIPILIFAAGFGAFEGFTGPLILLAFFLFLLFLTAIISSILLKLIVSN